MSNDFRYAFRTLLRNPGFTIVAALTIALGIGANTAIFTVVNGVLLRPLPFADPDRLMEIWTSTPSESRGNHSARLFLDLQRTNRTLAGVAGYRSTMMNASARPGEAAQLETRLVTIDFFDVLGVQPALGRTFSRRTDGASAERLVVLSRAAWLELFSDDAGAVGQRIRLNGEPHTVVGILPAGTEWPDGTRLWVLSPKPVPPSPLITDDPAAADEVGYISVVARLKADVSVEQAQDDLSRVARDSQQQGSAAAEPRDLRIGPLHEQIVGDVRPALLVLQAAVGLVLLVACANISSLLLARASGRRRELAIRAALGASRQRLIRQVLAESLTLGAIGALSGLLLGAWLLALLTRVLPADIPLVQEVSLDWTVALATLATALVSSMLFGAMPALQASQTQAMAALKVGTRSSRTRGRAMLVVAEIALTLVLLVGAGLLINSLLRLQRVDSGFRPEHATVMSVAVPEARYATATMQTAFYDQVIERLSERPEVQVAAIGFPGPLRGENATGGFAIEGRPSSPSERPYANIASVSGSYFAAMGIPLASGRVFTQADRPAGVAVINHALARKYFAGADPIGKRIRFDEDERAPWIVVIGVVGDARQLGLHAPAPPILYFPYDLFPLPFTSIVVRSPEAASAIAAMMRAELTELEPQLSIADTSALQLILDRSIDPQRFRGALVGAFAALALLLAMVGVYGLISHSVAQRTREIGIRMALGAPRRQVIGSVLREGLGLALAGIAIGLIGAVAASRALSRFLFEVGVTDPLTFSAVCVLLLMVTLLASYVPSRRAVRVDPVEALRSE